MRKYHRKPKPVGKKATISSQLLVGKDPPPSCISHRSHWYRRGDIPSVFQSFPQLLPLAHSFVQLFFCKKLMQKMFQCAEPHQRQPQGMYITNGILVQPPKPQREEMTTFSFICLFFNPSQKNHGLLAFWRQSKHLKGRFKEACPSVKVSNFCLNSI